MNKQKLPKLKDVLLKGFLSFTKGVNIGKTDIDFESTFEPICMDVDNLNTYKKEFGFSSQIPLTYFYLLAQRAQVAQMLDKRFTISIPGLIHISNKVENFADVDIFSPIQLKGTVFVPSKSEGSLHPVFTVQFYQNEKLIAFCESKYIAKRKSNGTKKKKKQVLEPLKDNGELIKLSKKQATRYAGISGDYNPIHVSTLAAKLFGFKNRIMHGWYLVSLAAKRMEDRNGPLKFLESQFIKAVQLPSSIHFIKEKKHAQMIVDKKVSINVKVDYIKPLI